MEEKLKFAVFIDFDNIEIGVKTTLGREFDVSLVLEALKERGEVVTKYAYGNWKMAGRYSERMAGHAVQLVQRDPSPRGDKNGGDITLALDALEMAFTRDFINAYCIVGGDSDFMALVEKLKLYNKAVFIIGGRGFTSTILQKNCREFIAYENLLGESGPAPAVPAVPSRPSSRGRSRRGGTPRATPREPQKEREDVLPLSNALPLLGRALKVLAGREHEPLLGLVKSTMMQLDSTFTERDYGVSSFLDFAKKLAADGLIRLDRQNGNYLVAGIEGEQPVTAQPKESREDVALNVLREVLLEAAQRGRREFHIHGLKQFVSKLRPGFDERKYGFKQFSALMNLAHDRGLVSIAPDERGAMRVRTIVEPAPVADAPVDLELLPAPVPEVAAEVVSGGELPVEGIGAIPTDAAPEPEPTPAEPAPKRRRRAASGSSPKPRAPRKKKTPSS